MGYRGTVELAELHAVDFGNEEFGLVFENPPEDQSERWNGRPARRFVVAKTYPEDVRQAEKEVFLQQLAEAQCVLFGTTRSGLPKKSPRVFDEGSSGDSFEVYWTMLDRPSYDQRGANGRVRFSFRSTSLGLLNGYSSFCGMEQGKMALQLATESKTKSIEMNSKGPTLVIQVILLGKDTCRCVLHSQIVASYF
jgi:hypothetical protein